MLHEAMPYEQRMVHACPTAWVAFCMLRGRWSAALHHSHGAGGVQIARFNLHGVRLMNRQGPSNRPSTRADIVRTVESLPPVADSA
jgi:hypothetical protein